MNAPPHSRRIPLVPRLALIVLASLLVAPPALAQDGGADCGGLDRPIVFGDLDWDSAQVANWIARLILEDGFGCTTDAIPGTVVPLYQGAVRGDVDVLMEVWVDNAPDVWYRAVEEGTIEVVGTNFDDAEQGWYVPRYLVEGDAERGIEPAAPDLRHVDDLPRYAHLFRDPEQPEKGRFYNCVIGWQCELINTVKLHAYGLTEHFTDFHSGTGVGLAASLEGAYLRGEPWLGYYWGPTWVLGTLDLLRLEEPPFTEECWDHYTSLLDRPEEAERACAYPTSTTVVAIGSRFQDDVPDAVLSFLREFRTTSAHLSELLAFIQEHDATPAEAAAHFLATRRDVWAAWLPPEAFDRIDGALAR